MKSGGKIRRIDDREIPLGDELISDVFPSRLERTVRDLLQILISGLDSAGRDVKCELQPTLSNLAKARDRLLRHPDLFYAATFVLEANQLVGSRTREMLVGVRAKLADRIAEISRTLVDWQDCLQNDSNIVEEDTKDYKERLFRASRQISQLVKELKAIASANPAISVPVNVKS